MMVMIYTTYTVDDNLPMTVTLKNFTVTTLWQFFKIIISPTYSISYQHVQKRNITKVMIFFYCCSSKMEEVMNFCMNIWVIYHPRRTANAMNVRLRFIVKY